MYRKFNDTNSLDEIDRSKDPLHSIQKDISSNEEKSAYYKSKTVLKNLTAVCIAEQLSVEGTDAGPMKRRICLLLNKTEYKTKDLNEIHLAASRDCPLLSELMIYCVGNYFLRKYKKKDEIEKLKSILTECMYILAESQLKIATSAGIATEVLAILNDPSLDLFKLNEVLKLRMLKLRNNAKVTLTDDFLFRIDDTCDKFNFFGGCKDKNCEQLHFCKKCKKDHAFTECPKVENWQKQKLKTMNYDNKRYNNYNYRQANNFQTHRYNNFNHNYRRYNNYNANSNNYHANNRHFNKHNYNNNR